MVKPLVAGLSVFWVLAILIRVTSRDTGGTIASLIFYMSPLILLSLGAALFFLLAVWVRWYRVALIWLLMSLITGNWCYQSQFRSNSLDDQVREDTVKPIRVLFWNVGDRIWSEEHMVREIRHVDADLVGLVEADSYAAVTNDFWKKKFPEYRYRLEHSGFVFLSRYPVVSQETGKLARMGTYWRLAVLPQQTPSGGDEVPGGMTVFLVDIFSHVLRSRKDALDQLAGLVAESDDQPVLVLGDFNTPGDSNHFRRLRKWCRNTFEVAGDGFNATWPMPFPVLDLDTIWVNRHFQVLSAENRSIWFSDHRPVVAAMSLQTKLPAQRVSP